MKSSTIVANRQSQALLICNGEPPRRKLAIQIADEASLIVAADGGANIARTLGIRPGVIIGDLDSVTKQTLKFFASAEHIRVRRQDNTDLEKALDHLVDKKQTSVTILAATGKRLDHTLGNLAVLWNYTRSLAITVVADDWIAVPIDGTLKAEAKVGTTVSLIPFGACSGITLRGLQYPLTEATMAVGEIGVSNVVVKPTFSIRVRRGKMLAMVLSHHSTVKILS